MSKKNKLFLNELCSSNNGYRMMRVFMLENEFNFTLRVYLLIILYLLWRRAQLCRSEMWINLIKKPIIHIIVYRNLSSGVGIIYVVNDLFNNLGLFIGKSSNR